MSNPVLYMKYPVMTIAKFTILEAIRNHLFLLILTGIVVIFLGNIFVAELSVTETRELQSTVLGFVTRIYAVVVISLFVITTMLREFHDKNVEMIISRDLPRYVYFLGKFTGFIMLVLVVSLLISIPLYFYSSPAQVGLWTVSLICELSIIVTLCLLFLFTFENITAAFTATAAFYILARCISTIQLISQSPLAESNSIAQVFITKFITFLSYILPHFDVFTQTDWLVYGTGKMEDINYIVMQTFIYIILLSAAALYDLYRKNF